MDLWIDCFGVFKLGVSEAAVHNGNTRLPDMHVELGYISILSIEWLYWLGMFSLSFKCSPVSHCSISTFFHLTLI